MNTTGSCICTEQRKKQIPWYKERIKTLYLKSKDPREPSKFLHPQAWTFLKSGLDDFRDGYPKVSNANSIIKPKHKGVAPNIVGDLPPISSTKRGSKTGLTANQTYFSKTLPMEEKKQQYISDIEQGLTNHPLALYPHYSESVQPEVFEDIVDIIDPELNTALEADDNASSYSDSLQELAIGEQPKSSSTRETIQRNPYRWLPRKNEDQSEMMRPPEEDEHMAKVTKDFCEWVRNLGGSEDKNIEETTIQSLFASGYETKPALSVPIHVVEIMGIPPELRSNTSAQTKGQTKSKNFIPERVNKAHGETPNEEDLRKFRYGAWYLPKKFWRKMDDGELLKDPKEEKMTTISETQAKSHSLDEELAHMHGPKAFIEFMSSRGERLPEFIRRVREIQTKVEKEPPQTEGEQDVANNTTAHAASSHNLHDALTR